MKVLNALLAATLVGISLSASAHEGVDHGPKAGPVKKEQKAWGVAGDAKAINRTIEIARRSAYNSTGRSGSSSASRRPSDGKCRTRICVIASTPASAPA